MAELWQRSRSYAPLTAVSGESRECGEAQGGVGLPYGRRFRWRAGRKRSAFETTPILVDGRLYLTTPFNRVIALDPATGEQLWAYDPQIDQTLDYGDGLINRGRRHLGRSIAQRRRSM